MVVPEAMIGHRSQADSDAAANVETDAAFAAPLSPPSLSTSAIGTSSITWTWTGNPSAASYNFYPSTGGPAIATADTTLTQTGLTPESVRVNLCRGMKLLRGLLGGTESR